MSTWHLNWRLLRIKIPAQNHIPIRVQRFERHRIALVLSHSQRTGRIAIGNFSDGAGGRDGFLQRFGRVSALVRLR